MKSKRDRTKEVIQQQERRAVRTADIIERDNDRKARYRKSIGSRYGKMKARSLEIHSIETDMSKEVFSALLSDGYFYCFKDLSDSCGVGLDRINPAHGYTKNNVVPCCGDCNMIRNLRITPYEMLFVADLLTSLRANDSGSIDFNPYNLKLKIQSRFLDGPKKP